MRKLLYFMMTIAPLNGFCQLSLSLDSCYQLAIQSSPLSQHIPLLYQKRELDRSAVKTARLPQFDLSVQATYQSDVTSLPVDLPNLTIEPVPKDQYKTILQVNESIYDGGKVTKRIASLQAENEVAIQQVKTSLYHQKFLVNQYFFGTLLAQERIRLLRERRRMVKAREKQVQAGVDHGVLDITDLSEIRIELLRIEQLITEATHNRSAMLQSLRRLTGQESDSLTLIKPEILKLPGANQTITRPEIDLFTEKNKAIHASADLIRVRNTPQLYAFAQLGYGNPALNMLENEFNPFYMVGAKFQWTPFDWHRTRKEVQSLNIQGAMIERERSDFERKTSIELDRLMTKMYELQEMLDIDKEIVRMRDKIREKSAVRLAQGAITHADYIDSVTDLYEAKNLLVIHEIDFLLTKANYLITKGN